MKFNKQKIRARVIGVIMLLLNLPIFALGCFALWFMIGSMFAYGTYGMFPGLVLALTLFIVTLIMLIPSVRYLRNKPFKQNKVLGLILISLGILNLVYKLATFFGGTWGGAPGRVVIAGFFSVYFFVFGSAFMIDYYKVDKEKN